MSGDLHVCTVWEYVFLLRFPMHFINFECVWMVDVQPFVLHMPNVFVW